MKKPLVSIGIIFKNEIRCLERCLTSLQPLREAVPCELVMADTGSDDGSRAVAAKYADILFDFPWSDDFSAARNAVMDRCSGTWYLSIDADEWLDPDIGGLMEFLRKDHKFNFLGVTIRNYKTPELEAGGLYMDFTANRMVRMSTGLRYQGAIHEGWDATGQQVVVLKNFMFHHDGYVHTKPGSRKVKEERNLRMLHKMLEERPNDLKLLIQCYESSFDYPEEHMDYIRRAMRGVEEKWSGWEVCGAVIFRHAAAAALAGELPELEQWIARARELFPNSIVTRLDVNHTALCRCWNQADYAGCIRCGEAYFRAVDEFERDEYDIRDVAISPLLFTSLKWQQTARGFLASAYLYEKRPEDCAQALKELFRHPLDEKQTEEAVRTLVRLHMLAALDTAPLVLALWERVNEPVPTVDEARKRLEVFNSMGFGVFQPDFRLDEGKPVLRPGHSLFTPLEGKCSLGRVAALYGADGPSELRDKLAAIEDLNAVPICVLAHALERGVEFPLPGKPLNIEEMDGLAGRLAQDWGSFFPLVPRILSGAREGQGLAWARAVALTAVQSCSWDTADVTQGLSLARGFARVEALFLPCCYAQEALREDRLYLLPPMHRFGWWCAKAFAALDAGDAVGYAHCLREGLSTCRTMRPMVEFLMNNTPELRAASAPMDELKALAEQIRAVLTRFAPNDPMVVALKQSEAYQKVAHLIEGVAPPVVGGQLQ